MIRTNNRILAETNSPNTVKTTEIIDNNKLLIGNTEHSIKKIAITNSILISNELSNITGLNIPSGSSGQNRYLATDSSKILILK